MYRVAFVNKFNISYCTLKRLDFPLQAVLKFALLFDFKKASFDGKKADLAALDSAHTTRVVIVAFRFTLGE